MTTEILAFGAKALFDYASHERYNCSGPPLQFACEATLNLAKQPEILSLMRQVQFLTVFVGIETPEVDALKAMRKEHNAALPLIEAIKTLNNYGLEVTSGIILGLDTDTADTESRFKEFIDLSGIPILTINLLQALPRTPLWDRLMRAGRLIADDTGLESNVRFLRSHEEVVAMWRRCVTYAYDPDRLFARFAYQVDATYAHRMDVPVRGKLTIRNLREAKRKRPSRGEPAHENFDTLESPQIRGRMRRLACQQCSGWEAKDELMGG